jgi:gas vesicle structural protein
MTVASSQRRSGGYLERPAPSGLADVVEVILDKGLVIDAYVRVSLVGIELLTIDARIVIASVDTYLRFAEATNRLDLYEKGGKDLPEAIEDMQEGGAKGKSKGVLEGAKDAITGGDDEEDEEEEDEDGEESGGGRRRRRPQKAAARRRKQED